MTLDRVLVGLLGAGIVVFGVGALVTLALNTLGGIYATPAIAVIALVVVALVGAVALGARGAGRVSNAGYW